MSCLDCKVDIVRKREYYMLRDSVWLRTGLGKNDGLLCIGCCEKRLHRRLTARDFISALVNCEWDNHSIRLRRRLGNARAYSRRIGRAAAKLRWPRRVAVEIISLGIL